MEYLLVLIIILQTIAIVFLDAQNRRERKDLTLKIISKDMGEYISASVPEPESQGEVPDPYVDPSEVDPNVILKSKNL